MDRAKKKKEETSYDTNVAMCDNDEQLVPGTSSQSKLLYDGSGDAGNDPGT